MLRKALTEALWIIILAVLFGAAFLLAGCNNEGAGFSNSGAYTRQRQCMRVDKFGHQVWYSVPANRRCP